MSSVPPLRLQRSLQTVGAGDRLEVEADRAAAAVLDGRGPSHPSAARRPTTEQRLDGVPGSGQPLAASQREYFESRWGFDFSRVRIHADEQAARATRSLGARAYTVGSDVVLGSGQGETHSAAGRRLLAHELAHVIQQSGGTEKLSASAKSVQRAIGDGHDLASPWLAGDPELEGAFDNEAAHFLSWGSHGIAVKRVQQLLFFLGFDIGPKGADGIFGPDTDKAVRAFQARSAPPVDGIIGPITIGALDVQANRPEPGRTVPGPVPAGPPTGKPPSISVDKIDLVAGAAGAIGGYPAITSGDLNVPGPFNSPTAVNNALQVHFHLDHGASADLTPRREIQRTATMAGGVVSNNPPDQVLPPGVLGPPTPGGFTGFLIGPDGPGAHEIQRPDAHRIVVADAPGLSPLVPAQYPVTYRAHFIVTVDSVAGAPIARCNYDVLIDKRTPTEVPNTENRAVVTAKKDFVRGKDL